MVRRRASPSPASSSRELDDRRAGPRPARRARAICGCGWRGCGCSKACRSATWWPTRRCCPPESIRFFYVDRGWTDALVEGALSVGTVTTADRAALEGLYGAVRAEVDEAERLVRLPGWEPGAAVPTGPAGPISGFLLRSRMVSGWPGLHVRAYARDNLRLDPPIADDAVGERRRTPRSGRLGLLRLERLAPAVLLALFDGVPAVVHVEEPRAGVQFGVDETEQPGGDRRAREVRLREPATGERFADARRPRTCGSGAARPASCTWRPPPALMVAQVAPGRRRRRWTPPSSRCRCCSSPTARCSATARSPAAPALPPGAVFRPVVGWAARPGSRFAGG